MNDIKVIIDVGARNTDLPYKYPEAECHLFEPNKQHYDDLVKQFAYWPIVINEYGLGEKEEILPYNRGVESCVLNGNEDYKVQIKTLDWYIKKHKITQIDFLKIDTEAMDLLVLKGGKKALKITRYLQFETWDNFDAFHDFLGKDWHMVEIGERNVLCKKKQSNSVS